MIELIMTIGLDGSGRREWAFAQGRTVLSEEKADLEALREGRSVVFDAPNLSCRARKDFLNRINAVSCHKTAVLIATTVEKCMAAAGEIIHKQLRSFYPPMDYEGWDEIRLIYPEPCERVRLSELFFGKEGLVFLSQDNPFHSHSVGMHCILAAKNAAHLRPDDSVLWLAALLHDIGKRRTKAFVDSRGFPSEKAHYYGHEFASAYESLFVEFPRAVPESERLRVSALIVWHMIPYFFSNEKTRARYLRLWGETFLENMLVIEQADKGAQK